MLLMRLGRMKTGRSVAGLPDPWKRGLVLYYGYSWTALLHLSYRRKKLHTHDCAFSSVHLFHFDFNSSFEVCLFLLSILCS